MLNIYIFVLSSVETFLNQTLYYYFQHLCQIQNHVLENFVTLESVGFLPNIESHYGNQMEKGENSSMNNDTIFWKLTHVQPNSGLEISQNTSSISTVMILVHTYYMIG